MQVKINSVRLSYPNLFEAKAGPDGGEPKFSASFLMDKQTNEKEIADIRSAILTVAKAQWGEANVKWNGNLIAVRKPDGKAASVKVCLRDGSDKPETPGYGDGIMFFGASNKQQPPCVDKNPSHALTKLDGKPYAGCYVNAVVRLWAQDNAFGKRVNAQLQTVQFAADGESFGDAPVDPASVFTTVGESNIRDDEDSSIPF